MQQFDCVLSGLGAFDIILHEDLRSSCFGEYFP